MKKRWFLLGVFLFVAGVTLFRSPEAEGQRGGPGPLHDEARDIWKGNIQPDDLANWEKRLKRMKSWGRWPAVALSLSVIGSIHAHRVIPARPWST